MRWLGSPVFVQGSLVGRHAQSGCGGDFVFSVLGGEWLGQAIVLQHVADVDGVFQTLVGGALVRLEDLGDAVIDGMFDPECSIQIGARAATLFCESSAT